jgi:hypothetical protein
MIWLKKSLLKFTGFGPMPDTAFTFPKQTGAPLTLTVFSTLVIVHSVILKQIKYGIYIVLV